MSLTKQAADYISNKLNGKRPSIGMILGSGLSELAHTLSDRIELSYDQIPGFPKLNVHGHKAQLSCGYLGNQYVACLEGRVHYYEGADCDVIKHYIRAMKLIGCETLLMTNASGSLRQTVGPGSIVIISDHINFQGTNPLLGPNDDDFGPRFYPVDNAYDEDIRKEFLGIAKELDIELHKGVYIAVLGPNYETKAEIKAFQTLGADVIGMSTVPEVLVANHCGMKVVCLSSITNFATGLAKESHDHAKVVTMAQECAKDMEKLIVKWIERQ